MECGFSSPGVGAGAAVRAAAAVGTWAAAVASSSITAVRRNHRKRGFSFKGASSVGWGFPGRLGPRVTARHVLGGHNRLGGYGCSARAAKGDCPGAAFSATRRRGIRPARAAAVAQQAVDR